MSVVDEGKGAGLLAFLEWAGSRGEINAGNARGYGVAVGKILETEADATQVDIRSLDVEGLITRFETLNRLKYSTDSMKAYKSRFRIAVAMYLAFLNGDSNWKGAGKVPSPRSNGSSRTPRRPRKLEKEASRGTPAEAELPAQASERSRMVAYDMPLRPDLLVRLTLPFDLTRSDAERISAFVRSLAFDAPTGDTPGQAGSQERGD